MNYSGNIPIGTSIMALYPVVKNMQTGMCNTNFVAGPQFVASDQKNTEKCYL